jgi:hypothetical protein
MKFQDKINIKKEISMIKKGIKKDFITLVK